MLLILSLLLLLNTLPAQPVSADLQVIQFDPLIFLLTFSEPVDLPPFQLLLNGFNILNITFPPSFTNNTTIAPLPSTSYVFTSVNPYVTILENYSVQFTHPLAVGNGRLQLSDYVV
jgi:hypothetical protein